MTTRWRGQRRLKKINLSFIYESCDTLKSFVLFYHWQKLSQKIKKTCWALGLDLCAFWGESLDAFKILKLRERPWTVMHNVTEIYGLRAEAIVPNIFLLQTVWSEKDQPVSVITYHKVLLRYIMTGRNANIRLQMYSPLVSSRLSSLLANTRPSTYRPRITHTVDSTTKFPVFGQIAKCCKHFIEIYGIWSHEEIASKCGQMSTKAMQLFGVWFWSDL